MKNKALEVHKLSKIYRNSSGVTDVIKNLNFDVFDGEIVCILGTSGCGKSTLLNIISGLDKNFGGNINYYIDKQNIGYMLQDSALFPWLNIYENASLSSKIKGINNKQYIDNLLKKYDLDNFKDKYPNNLSGGMKQRVALIRTTATKPSLLLLDEPFAALDYQTRLLISNDVYKLIKERSITTIMITHDISEAISIADRVIVLSKRPCYIKNIYEINLKNKKDPINNRKDERFLYYFDKIGKDLDIFEEK